MLSGFAGLNPLRLSPHSQAYSNLICDEASFTILVSEVVSKHSVKLCLHYCVLRVIRFITMSLQLYLCIQGL